MTLGEIFIKLGLKSDDFNKGIDNAKQKTSGFGEQIGKIGTLIAGAFAASTVISWGKSLLSAWNESAKAQAKLEAVLKSTGGQAGVTAGEMSRLKNELKETTEYGGSTITNAEALMLTFTKIGKEAFPEAIKASANISAVLGQDLQQSVIQLGKALNSPVTGMTALKRVGVSFTESQVEMIKKLQATGDLLGAQKVILAELTTEFGGAAAAMAKAGTGPWNEMMKALKGVKVVLGEALGTAPGVNPVIGWFRGWFNDAAVVLKKDTTIAGSIGNAAMGLFGFLPGVKQMLANSAYEIKKQKDEADKAKEFWDAELAGKNKPAPAKRIFTKEEQYKSALESLKTDIKNAEQAALTADLGEPFIEASKAVADAKKALEDYIATYDNTKQNKEEYDKEVKALQSSMNEKDNILKKQLENQKITKEEYDVRYLRLSINTYEEEKKLAEKYGQQIADVESKQLDDRIKLREIKIPQLITKGSQNEVKSIKDPTLSKEGDANQLKQNYGLEEYQKAKQQEAYQKKIDAQIQFNQEFNGLIQSGMQEAATTFGEGIGALMSGDMDMKGFGKSMLMIVADFLVQFGEMLIKFAFASAAFQDLLKTAGVTWPVALAAGIALVAIGSGIKHSMQSQANGGSSGGGTSVASGSGSYNSPSTNSRQSLGGTVQFEIAGTKLVGVLANVGTNRAVTG